MQARNRWWLLLLSTNKNTTSPTGAYQPGGGQHLDRITHDSATDPKLLSKLLLRRQAIAGTEPLLGNKLHNQLSDALILWTIDRQLLFLHEDISLVDVYTSLLRMSS